MDKDHKNKYNKKKGTKGMKEEKIIGFVYRFDKNDYQITLNKFDENDQKTLLDIFTKYVDLDKCSGERGDKNLTLNDCNIDWWENGKEFD